MVLKSEKGREVSKGAVTWPDLPGVRVRVQLLLLLLLLACDTFDCPTGLG